MNRAFVLLVAAGRLVCWPPAVAAGPAVVGPGAPAPAPPVALPNDNRHPAGTLAGNVLTVQLEARNATWYPEGPSGRGLEVAAWAEPGQPSQVPGPLIRVTAGTEVRATLRNTLDRRLTVYGFGARRGLADSTSLDPGQAQEVRFVASTPGTYYYMASSGTQLFGAHKPEDMALVGAIVVDPAGGAAGVPDRVFLISWWFTFDTTSRTGLGRATMAINGLSWPHTERIDLVQGDSVRWRLINLTESEHPMHLHGFYFTVEGKGDGIRDTMYAPAERRQAVTEILNVNQTMTLSWVPTRPGNWIFHCHFIGHLSPLVSLDMNRGEMDEGAMTHHASDGPHQMYGLVLGIRVAPKGPVVVDTRPARPIRLVVREQPGIYGDHPGYAFVVDGMGGGGDSAALPRPPGPTLLLTRGERVAVTIVNQSQDRAAVHWHGIELESFPDGVPGWSGHGSDILPSVAPGDSITVRFTPPRAGTFMYHSHFNEAQQISSGLYGAIVVLDSTARFDPETDRVLVFSSAGPTTNVIFGPWAPILLNGTPAPAPLELRAGTTYRFRMIDITDDLSTLVSIRDGDTPVQWRVVAKDGATLPASQATARPAALSFDPGEIYDFEYTPASPGELSLRFGTVDAPPQFGLPGTVSVPVHVR
jgi:FtsP/CotA-like multicopper oxidase with cupredoxin domain